MIEFPAQYKPIIESFLIEYYQRRKWEIEQAFLGVQMPHLNEELLFGSALADQLAEIARAAAGELKHSEVEDDFPEGIIYEGIQDLCERLFAPPGLGSAYAIPAPFWATPLGQMVGRAYLWAQRDILITIREAAGLLGVTTQAIGAAIDDGRLRAYVDPDAPQRQGRRKVSKHQVLEMQQH